MEEAIKQFQLYTDSYLNISDMCKLKVNHTFRVLDLCQKIAIKLGLSEEDIFIAGMCGLLHDIARFEQWKEYKTFSDLKSIDHGDYGVKLLEENNFLRKFIEDSNYDSLILKATEYHNKYSIPDTLTEREELFTKIIRDADKIDIFYLFVSKESHIELGNDLFSNEIYEEIKNKKLIQRKNVKTKADELGVYLSFVFDINFTESIKIIEENNDINLIIDQYKNDNDILNNKLEEIRKIINNYIKERLDYVR